MRFRLRIYFICAVTFVLFISFKILEPEIRSAHPAHDGWASDSEYNQDQNHDHDIEKQLPIPEQNVKTETKLSRNQNNPGAIDGEPDIDKSSKDKNDLMNKILGKGEKNLTAGAIESKDERVAGLLKAYDVDWKLKLERSPWLTAAEWVTERHVHPDYTPEMGAILREMATRKIVKADVAKGGTQLKMSLILEGGQQVLFKPQWFERDKVIPGKPWNGEDRHNGEIAAFHLNRLMGFHIAPLVVGRTIDLEREIKPIAEQTLLNTFFEKDGNTCFYGKCYYCKGPETGVCGRGHSLEGVVVLWLPKTWRLQNWRHPWSRSYNKKIMKWEQDPNYCYTDVLPQPLFNTGPRLLDLIDIVAFDYLILNGDRHNYLTFANNVDSAVLLLDNGKSFANPHMDDQTILAPLEQCCRLRRRTWQRLSMLQDGVLSSVVSTIMDRDPIAPVLNKAHLKSLDRRLAKLMETVETCIRNHGRSHVLLLDEFS